MVWFYLGQFITFIILVGIIYYLVNNPKFNKNIKNMYTTIFDKIIEMPTAICVINYNTNKIIVGNKDFCKILNKKKVDGLDILDTKLFKNYQDYINIKNGNVNNDSDSIIITSGLDNSTKRTFRIKFKKIKIGRKPYLIFNVVERTHIIEYIKRLGIFAKIADNSKDGIMVVNISSDKNIPIIKYANESIGNITGYNITDIVNKPLSVIFENNVDANTISDLYTNIKNVHNTTIEYQYIKKDGTLCWIKTDIVPVIRKSVLDRLLDMDIHHDLDYIENISVEDIDIYITLYQKDITEIKHQFEVPKAHLEKMVEYNRSKDRFFNVISNLLDIAIENNKVDEVLRILAQCAEADRCYIFKVIDNADHKSIIQLSNAYFKDSMKTKSLDIVNNLSFEDIGGYRAYSYFLMKKPFSIQLENVQDNTLGKQYLDYTGIKSLLSYPILDEDSNLLGFITIDDVSNPNKVWNENINRLMKMITEKINV